MIVIDASILFEVLMRTRRGRAAEPRLADPSQTLHAPHLLDLEIASVVRRLAAAGRLDTRRAVRALTDLADLDVHRYEHEPLLPRIWELRHVLTVYDATYVALAESLDARLLTADRKLAGTRGVRVAVELLG